MAVKFVSIKCPECGASLDVEEGRQQIFCSYCGSKIMIQNDNEYIYRHIDEAGIKHAETEQMVKLKQMEMLEKKRVSREKVNALKIKISIVLGIIALFTLGIGFTGNAVGLLMVGVFALLIIFYMWIMSDEDKEEEVDFGDKVKVPSLSDFEKQSYVAIEAKFRSAGFLNIKCVPLNDLKMGLLKKPNMVESITINGHNTTSSGKKYPPDATVIITYHSLV